MYHRTISRIENTVADISRPGIEDLANRIIVVACEDYQKILCGRYKETRYHNIKELTSFFYGNWIRVLSTIDGPSLMHRLKDECEECNYSWSRVKKLHEITRREEELLDDYCD